MPYSVFMYESMNDYSHYVINMNGLVIDRSVIYFNIVS